jgi:hypothetical protein
MIIAGNTREDGHVRGIIVNAVTAREHSESRIAGDKGSAEAKWAQERLGKDPAMGSVDSHFLLPKLLSRGSSVRQRRFFSECR